MINPMGLTGKVVLISGASSGIGKSAAIQMSQLGARCILVARNRTRLEETLSKMEGKGHAIYSIDLSEIDEIEAHFKKIVQENGQLDGLVHCAGIAVMRPLRMLKYKNLHEVMLINFYSFIELTRCFSIKGNFNENTSSIIAISSIASITGNKSKIAYCASKAAIDGSVRSLSKELIVKNIRVNSIIAGFVSTEMYDEFVKSFKDADDAKITLERQYGGIIKPFEIANGIAYLLSDAAKSITGTSMRIDGGYLS